MGDWVSRAGRQPRGMPEDVGVREQVSGDSRAGTQEDMRVKGQVVGTVPRVQENEAVRGQVVGTVLQGHRRT